MPSPSLLAVRIKGLENRALAQGAAARNALLHKFVEHAPHRLKREDFLVNLVDLGRRALPHVLTARPRGGSQGEQLLDLLEGEASSWACLTKRTRRTVSGG